MLSTSRMEVANLLGVVLILMSVDGQSVLDGASLLDKCPLANIEELELLINSAARKVMISHLNNMDSQLSKYRMEMTDFKIMLKKSVEKNNMEIKSLKRKIEEQEALIKNLQKTVGTEAAKQGVRLVNGNSVREGRVEVYKEGVWGTVCDDSWDFRDANVICRQLFGLIGSPYSSAHFGLGAGVIHMDDVGCTGTESSLMHCRHKNYLNHNCGHGEDAGVVCMKAPPIRLSRQLEFQGRVEVYKNNAWGTICDDYWGHDDADVICRSLGYSEHGLAVSNAVFGEGIGKILFDDVKCRGEEIGLSDCSFSSTHNCEHTEDAGVICKLSNDNIRLSNGMSANEGFVEVLINGKWGAVCDIGWDHGEAKVACRTLGYSGGVLTTATTFGEGNRKIWLSGMDCNGNEDSILECSQSVVGSNSCGSSRNAGVVCYNILNEIMTLENKRSAQNENVLKPSIRINGNLVDFCVDGLDETAAKAMCRSFGYSGYASLLPTVQLRSSTALLINVECTGNEKTLAECELRASSLGNCNRTGAAVLKCYADVRRFIRLVNGSSSNEGRVEVFIYGEWGTVCDDDWGITDASVVCKSLGYSGISTAHTNAYFGPGTGRTWLDDVNCDGSEASIFDCRHRGYGKENCGHHEDAGVTCT